MGSKCREEPGQKQARHRHSLSLRGEGPICHPRSVPSLCIFIVVPLLEVLATVDVVFIRKINDHTSLFAVY